MNRLLRPFKISIPDEVIQDLYQRLDLVRWPDCELVDNWTQGVPLRNMKTLVDYWRNKYDWRRCEKQLNSYDQFLTEVDGVDIHVMHIRSECKNALPLMMTPGWPGSIVEFLKVIGPLTDPESYGGKAEESFHLIIPSIPGYGFSGIPTEPGWTLPRITEAFQEVLKRLGYEKYVVQGGGMGGAVASTLGSTKAPGLIACHVNLPFVLPRPPYGDNLSEREQAALDALAYMDRWGTGYALLNQSRPETIGYGLADSPVGQAAWIYEKLYSWSDCGDAPENVFTYDEILDMVMMYWLTNTAVSTARFYWDNYPPGLWGVETDVPTGVSIFPKEIWRAPRKWADMFMHDIIYWHELDAGGHFAAFERPELFVEEVRNCFMVVR